VPEARLQTFLMENLHMLRLLSRSLSRKSRGTAPAAGRARPSRLGVEPLEDRSVPATLSFAATAYDAGRWPAAVAVGDFNGDGNPDLASPTSSVFGDTVSVMLGQGDGTFAPKTSFPTGGSPRMIATGDFNRDGNLDLVTNNGTLGVSVLLGRGDGTIAARADFATDTQPMSVAVADFDRDGDDDLATANVQGANDVSVLLSQGDGTFAPKTDFAVGTTPTSVVTGDFNGDGKPDLATANVHDSTVSVLLGAGDGSFVRQADLAAGPFVRSLAVADFNQDGTPDLAAGYTGGVSVLPGNGDGSFDPRVDYAFQSVPESVAVADFNGDGRADLAAAGGFSGVAVLVGRGDGTFAPGTDFAGNTFAAAVAVGDFNRDGKPDLASANMGLIDGTTSNLTVLVNTSLWAAPEAIDRVTDALETVNLPGDVANSVASKLHAAQAALDQGNETPARNLIESAIHQLESLVQAGQLDSTEADPLIADLEAALALL
jgi:hypothetical protein